mgnify:FL=1
MIDSNQYLSDRIKPLKASAIREMFKRMADPEIISLAGGSPDPALFPGEELSKIAGKILMTNPAGALQYGTTDGYKPFIEQIRKRVDKVSAFLEGDRIIVTTGAQQGIDLAAKILINDGENVVVEAPSFVGTLNSLRSYRANLIGIPVLSDGMDLDKLEEVLKEKKVKLIYTIPTFQNPSGITMSLEKRKRLLALASQYDVIIIEDNPYGDLRFAGEDVPTIKSMDTEGRVIYVGSFSKILSPGMRLGYTVCNEAFSDRIEVAKQVNDVHTPLLTQMMATEFLKKYDIEEYIKKSCKLYGEKCKFMLDCMEQYFPKTVTWTHPEGGIFVLCTAPEGTDSGVILEESLKAKVAFVPGNNFSTDITAPSNLFRLNYSMMPEEKIEKGIKILGDVLKKVVGE